MAAPSATFYKKPVDETITGVGAVEIATLLNVIRQSKLENHEMIVRNWPEANTSDVVYTALIGGASPFTAAPKIKRCFDLFSNVELATVASAAVLAGNATFTVIASTAKSA